MSDKKRKVLNDSLLKSNKSKNNFPQQGSVNNVTPKPLPVQYTAATLHHIDEQLRQSEVEDLKFLTNDLITASQLDKCTRGFDVFDKLQLQGLISAENGSLLIELLMHLGKLKLVRQLGVDPRRFKEDLQLYGGFLYPYRVLLWKFCEEVDQNEFKSLKHLAKDFDVSRQDLEQVATMTGLVKLLEDREVLCNVDTTILMNMAALLKRSDLQDLVLQYQANPMTPPSYQRLNTISDATAPFAYPVHPYHVPTRSYLESPPISGFQAPPPYSQHASLQEETLSGAGSVHNFYREKRHIVAEPFGQMPQQLMQPVQPGPPVNLEMPEYKMDAKPRGYAVIINNRDFYHLENDPSSRKFSNREGTEVDVGNLEYIWKKLQFEVKTYANLTDTEIVRLMIEYGTTPRHTSGNIKDHTNKDCFVCCILSHGTIGGIYGVNGKLVPIKDITNNFKGLICPGLINKPKLFFIQACLGTDKQRGAVGNGQTVDIQQNSDIQQDSAGETMETVPNEADFLLGFSTTPGFVSYRSKEHGSWYITKLVQMLDHYADRYDLLSILVRVNEEVGKAVAQVENSDYKQSPAPLVTLRKRVVFR